MRQAVIHRRSVTEGMLHCSWQVLPGSVQGRSLLLSHSKALTFACLRVAGAPIKAMPMSLLHFFRWPARSPSLEPQHT